MIRRTPRSTLTDSPLPFSTLCLACVISSQSRALAQLFALMPDPSVGLARGRGMIDSHTDGSAPDNRGQTHLRTGLSRGRRALPRRSAVAARRIEGESGPDRVAQAAVAE